MKYIKIIFGMLIGWVLVPGQAVADPAILAGEFTADSPLLADQLGPGERCNANPKIYAVAGPFQASSAGEYIYQDGTFIYNQDIVVTLYSPSFDPANPTSNKIETWDDHGHADLSTGTDYYLVVQTYCENTPTPWAATFQGPGNLTGDTTFTAPMHWFGNFDGTESLTQSFAFDQCGDTYYEEMGPIQVPQSGVYFFSDLTNWDLGLNVELAVYDGAFNPDNPETNLVANVIFQDEMPLLANTDYTFVAKSLCDPTTGDWFYTLAPSVPFEINPGLNGAFVNPATPGQGFLLDVLPDFGIVFYAEFTYDTMQPAGGENGEIGAPGNRWYTAQGSYEPGDQAVEMPVYVSSGGLFNDPTAVTTEQAGTLTLEFSEGCSGGTRTYDFDSGVMGENEFQRLANDNLELCFDQYKAPAVLTPPAQ